MGMLRRLRLGVALPAVFVPVFLPGQSVRAAVITVTTTAESPGAAGDCTLGEAIQAAEMDIAADGCAAGSGADTIGLPTGTYSLATGTATAAGVSAFVVGTPITILGNGATLMRDPVTNNLRFFEVTAAGVLSLGNLTLSNGWAIGAAGAAGAPGGPGRGGAIHNRGMLTLTAVGLSGNRARGGVGSPSPSSVGSRGAPGGMAQGGAIYNAGTLLLGTVTATGNSVEGGRGGPASNLFTLGGPGGPAQGGALYHLAAPASTLTVTDGGFTANRAVGGATGTSSVLADAGDAAGEAYGGAIHAEGDTSPPVTVTRTNMMANEVVGGGAGIGGPAVPADGLGGAISTIGATLTLTQSTLSSNTATGGAANAGALGLGGALSVQYASATIVRTAIVHNMVAGGDGLSSDGTAHGGGLYAVEAQLALSNVTLSDNRANDGGGGIHAVGSGNVALSHATVAHNRSATGASGLALASGATATFAGTAIVNLVFSSSLINCSGVVANLGGNLQFPGTTCGSGIPTADPLLAPLQEEGGTTVHPLGPLSPALDAANQNGCPATDQRGVMRPIDGDDDGLAVCDTGAYEAVPDDLIFADGFAS
jgi:CSLREA domain-containing protein